MPTFAGWIASDSVLEVADDQTRAALEWRRIQDRPTDITIKRGPTTLSAQTVRVEYNVLAHEQEGAQSTPGMTKAVVFGIRNHPDPRVLDTNIKRGDRFVLNEQMFEVMTVMFVPGEVQAICEAKSA